MKRNTRQHIVLVLIIVQMHLYTHFCVQTLFLIYSLLAAISSVIESHPDNALEDLRLDQPFAEFKKHIQSYDLDSMDKKVFILGSSNLRICYPCLNYVNLNLCLISTYSVHFYSLIDLQDHSHTPWIIIVAKYLEKWLSEVKLISSPVSIYFNSYYITDVKWYSTFVFVEQLSTTKKLQGERGLQTVNSGRYLWTWGVYL